MLPVIIGFGEALIDILPTGEVIGGAPLNFAMRAAELGELHHCRSVLVTRIGADKRGKRILERLRQSPVDLSGTQIDDQRPTGYVNVSLNNGQPDYTIGRNVAWEAIEPSDTALRLATQAKAICYGTLSQLGEVTAATLRQLLGRSSQAVRILDLNLRKPLPALNTIEWSLQQADVLKCNLEELQQLATWFNLSDLHRFQSVSRQLQNRFQLQSVFLTRGNEGCSWLDGTDLITSEVPQLYPELHADSVGAGDAACAALAVGLVQGWDVQRIVRVANWCGAHAACTCGATAPLGEEVIRMVVD
jgi:fructokinase